MIKSIEIRNLKKIKNINAEFENGNLYLIKGQNEVGKSTFINTILTLITNKNIPDVPITTGETKAIQSGEFEIHGVKYKIIIEYRPNTKKLSIVFPDGHISNKINDLYSIFSYTNITAEEFLKLSETAEGKRKQRDILLGLLSEELRKEFFILESEEEKLYEERKLLNKEIEKFNILKNSLQINDEDLKYINNNNNIDNEINNISIKRVEQTKILNLIENDKNNFSEIKNAYDNFNKIVIKNEVLGNSNLYKTTITEIKSFDLTKILLTNLDTIIKHYNESKKQIEELNNKFIELNNIKNKIDSIQEKVQSLKEYNNTFTDLETKLNILKTQLEDIRIKKINFFNDNKYPINNISFEDGEIKYKNLPLNSNQISTSESLELVTDILYNINKKCPIILLGRVESFDDDKITKLNKFAKENNCQIFAEKVIGKGGLTIELFEENQD